ncbi:MAG TPA: cytochrome b/b6 domain-containing protein [Kiritimatiellia bacterium]|nr:cytochrome b/b6 domain-containing protein [Kiritimatiellia bacterium]
MNASVSPVRIVKVWTYPIRIIHALLLLNIALALILGLSLDDDHAWFDYHMLFGLSAGFLLIIRLIIGLTGTRHASLRALVFPPRETATYLWKALTGRAKRYVGHNPGTAAAALVMFVCLVGLIASGLSMPGEAAEEVHEMLANLMLAAIGAHVVGLALHTWHHRGGTALSMVTGRKPGIAADEVPNMQWGAGLLVLALCGLCMTLMFSGYDLRRGTLNLPVIGSYHLGKDHEHKGNNQLHGHRETSGTHDEHDE